MPVWTLALKDLRLLARDPRAAIILFIMPLLFILVLGVSLGEGFGQKPEDRLKVSVLNLDEGPDRFFERPAMIREGMSWLTLAPHQGFPGALNPWPLVQANYLSWFPHEPWSEILLKDLGQTANIKVEFIDVPVKIEWSAAEHAAAKRAEAERLVRSSRRAAVLVLGKNFSRRVERCSFLAGGGAKTVPLEREGINPFYRDGVNLNILDVEVLRDPSQQTASAIIDQVAQGSMLRVVMPWMIGRAFEQIGDPKFLDILAKEQAVPGNVKFFLAIASPSEKKGLSAGLQNSLQNIFPKYNLTAKTWAALTKEVEHGGGGAGTTAYHEEGQGWLKRGAIRYQLLVPSYLVMFAFFLVLTVGWLFVAERRQGTLQRLKAAPISQEQLLLGKLLPCYLVSLFQGFFLLIAGRLLFGMKWGDEPLWLIPLVASTSLAAMGLALLIATLARTETQVAIYGTLIVLMLSALSGSLMGDRSLMPEQMQEISLFTPHAWALDAYRQMLTVSPPNLDQVTTACGVLCAFGVGFLAVAWLVMKLER